LQQIGVMYPENDIIDSDLHLYAVYPVGHMEILCMVIDADEQGAIMQSLHQDSIMDMASKGLSIVASDLTKQFVGMGYMVTISRQGVFH